VNIDEVIAAYVKLRDAKEELQRKHKEELIPVRQKMDRIESWLQNELQKQSLQSFKGDAGTAFLQEETSATVADWDATLAYIRENDKWELLEKRVSKTVVADHIETFSTVPPGVSFRREMVVRVRRG
jgi:hypothetical protein